MRDTSFILLFTRLSEKHELQPGFGMEAMNVSKHWVALLVFISAPILEKQ